MLEIKLKHPSCETEMIYLGSFELDKIVFIMMKCPNWNVLTRVEMNDDNTEELIVGEENGKLD